MCGPARTSSGPGSRPPTSWPTCLVPRRCGALQRHRRAVSLRFLQGSPAQPAGSLIGAWREPTATAAAEHPSISTGASPVEGTRSTATPAAAWPTILPSGPRSANSQPHRRAARRAPRLHPCLEGTIRGRAREIGDCRRPVPRPRVPRNAGVAPSILGTAPQRRWACNKKLRDALCDFAGDSRHANAWAQHRYQTLRKAGKRHPHAERILARSWAHIIWRCWQDHTPYDPTRHRAHQQLGPNPA